MSAMNDSEHNPFLRQGVPLEVEDECWQYMHPKIVHYIKFEADVKWCSYNILQLWRSMVKKAKHRQKQLGAVGVNYDMLADLVIEQLRDNELEGLRIVYQKQGMKVEPYRYEQMLEEEGV
jgi:hypothetical protein